MLKGLKKLYSAGITGCAKNISIRTAKGEQKVYDSGCLLRNGILLSDRFVIVGSHRDAWVYGAADPGGGGAVMLEVSSAMAQMMVHGKSGAGRKERIVRH